MDLNIRRSDLYGWIIAAIIVIFSTVSGLIIYFFPSTGKQITFLMIGCILYFRVILRHPVKDFRILSMLLLLLFFVLRNSLYLDTAGAGIASLLTYTMMFLLCYYSQYDGAWINKVLPLLGIIYFLYCLCTIWFYFDSYVYLNYIVNLFPDTRSRLIAWYNSGCMAGLTNHYSTNAMFISSGLILYCTRMLKRKKKSLSSYLLIFFAVICLLLTGKRGHVLFAAGALFITYYIYAGKSKRTRWQKLAGIILLVVCSLGIIFTAVPELSTFITRFQEGMDSGDITTNRTEFWKLAMELFRSSPILGIGWNRFRGYSAIILNYSAYAHNIYIQLLCETGVIGFIAYVTWMITMLYKGIRNFIYLRDKDLKEDDYSLYYGAFSVAYQTFFLLYGLTGNPLYDKETYIVYFVSCAIVIYQENLFKVRVDVKEASGNIFKIRAGVLHE